MRDSDRKALAVLANKPRVFDLSDLILMSMGDTMSKLAKLHEDAGFSLDSVVSLGPDVEVTIKKPESLTGWKNRLRELVSGAQSIAQQHDLDPDETVGKMLDADGWVRNHVTLKTPAWMVPHAEVRLEKAHKAVSDLGTEVFRGHEVQEGR